MGSKKYTGRGPGGTSRPGNRPRGGNYSGPRTGTGGGGGGIGRGTNHKGGESSCSMSLPVAVAATLFYALPRLAFDSWRSRRAG